jgi:uncharacterized protein involved in exopolysaccharide biosynthesis
MEGNEKKKININFFKLVKVLKEDKWITCVYCFIGAILGIIIAFSIPKIYKTTVMLAPESSSSSSLTSNISSLASMVGMDMKFGDGNDAIYPEIYPDLMGSTDFLVSMFPVKVKSLDGKINTNYFDYLKKFQKVTWWSYPKIWLTEMTKNIAGPKKRGNSNTVNPFELTLDQYDIAQAIHQNIDCNVDKKTNVITIEVTDQDPLISATLADSVKQRLQIFITKYRTNKARNDLAYMQRLFNEAKSDYTRARQQYATFSDANQDLLLESYRSKQEDLENEMQLRYNIYTQVMQQLQLSKAKVQERTPAFTVVQSASVPVKHSNKPKIIIILTYIFLAYILRACIILYKKRDLITNKD